MPYLNKIQQEKAALGASLKEIRIKNNITERSVERVYPERWMQAIENGSFVTDNGEVINIEKILGYCDLIGASISINNLTTAK